MPASRTCTPTQAHTHASARKCAADTAHMRTRMQVQYKLRHSDSRVVVVEEQKMIDSLAKQARAPRNDHCAALRASSAM